MHEIYDKWHEIAKNCYQNDLEQISVSGISHIVFAGMGGSGAINDLISAVLSKTNVHVCVVKGYHLPRTIDSKTLVITTSVSGNTVETLTVLKSAKKSGCKVIAFSNGGIMEKYCQRNKIEHRHVQKYHSPRASFTSFLFSMLRVLQPILPIKSQDITAAITDLKKLQKNISTNNITEKNPALNLARWITDFPIIYYPWGLQAAAIRFKNSLQENAKMHTVAEDIIEACHNGIVAWEKQSDFKPILIRGQDDYIKTKERWKILEEYFQTKNIEYREIQSVDGSILTKLTSLIYLLDYCSIYRAVLSGIDPSPVRSIDYIKERLTKF